jgi:hypothetical protein
MVYKLYGLTPDEIAIRSNLSGVVLMPFIQTKSEAQTSAKF